MTDAGIPAVTSAPMKRKSRFFGQYIVKTRFQFKFSVFIFLFLAAACFLIWLMGLVAVKNMVNSGMVTGEDAIAQLKLINSIVAKTSIISLAVTFGLALFFSHYIAGPIYRFERTLEQMRDGDLTANVRLRKHDELKDVADLFNQMLASLRNKVKKEREVLAATADKALPVIEHLRQSGQSADADSLQKIVQEIKSSPPQIRI